MALDLIRSADCRAGGGLGWAGSVEVEVCGGKHRMLRVFIDRPSVPAADRPDGVTHEDCSKFSREFGTIVDVRMRCRRSYVLEVSSPG